MRRGIIRRPRIEAMMPRGRTQLRSRVITLCLVQTCACRAAGAQAAPSHVTPWASRYCGVAAAHRIPHAAPSPTGRDESPTTYMCAAAFTGTVTPSQAEDTAFANEILNCPDPTWPA